jgi:hypothetical protein
VRAKVSSLHSDFFSRSPCGATVGKCAKGQAL